MDSVQKEKLLLTASSDDKHKTDPEQFPRMLIDLKRLNFKNLFLTENCVRASKLNNYNEEILEKFQNTDISSVKT